MDDRLRVIDIVRETKIDCNTLALFKSCTLRLVMGVSFQARNPQDSSASYRPHLRGTRVSGQAHKKSFAYGTLLCGAAAIYAGFRCRSTTSGQMVAGLKRDPQTP
jgi:hypothetical protein